MERWHDGSNCLELRRDQEARLKIVNTGIENGRKVRKFFRAEKKIKLHPVNAGRKEQWIKINDLLLYFMKRILLFSYFSGLDFKVLWRIRRLNHTKKYWHFWTHGTFYCSKIRLKRSWYRLDKTSHLYASCFLWHWLGFVSPSIQCTRRQMTKQFSPTWHAGMPECLWHQLHGFGNLHSPSED